MVKPGYKTTEFWLTVLVMLLGLLMGSGVIAPDTPWAKMVGVALNVLAALGYTAARAKAKSAESLSKLPPGT